jgi:hypothetical protein
MRIVLGVLAFTAVACGDDGNMFPVGGGGNDGGTTFPDSSGPADSRNDGGGSDGGDDAAITPIDAAIINGRVCLLTDPRVLNQCASTGANGLTVRLGTASAVTTANGSFAIAATGGDVWRVTGPNIVSSFEVLADYFIPAMPRTLYDAMMTANNVTEYPGEGALMIFASYDGAAVAGLTATNESDAFYEPFYDGGSPTSWGRTMTGANGVVWLPGIDVGTASVEVGGATSGGPVYDGGITFANALVPAPPL